MAILAVAPQPHAFARRSRHSASDSPPWSGTLAWSLSDDKTTYTFKLQDNVKFHDGHPLTADDVIFSISDLGWASLISTGSQGSRIRRRMRTWR